jgi:pimeloyl-ACP methyl ester carboxylesterase
MLAQSPLAMALDSTGVNPYPVLGRSLLPGGPVDMGIYEPLMTGLANGGYNPTFWGYDWRLHIPTIAQRLATYLLSANLTNPFHVVAHSMGGLIAQLAYPIYAASSPANVWGKTVYLGTPHGGSYNAAAALAGSLVDGWPLTAMRAVYGLVIPSPGSLNTPVVTALKSALGIMLGSWPSLYQLLPNPGGPWAADDLDAADLLALALYAQTWGGQQAQWFTLAASVQRSLVTALSGPRATEIVFYGTQGVTLAGYNGQGENPAYQSSYQQGDGDGTVPTHRAQLPVDSGSSDLQGIAHLDLPRSLVGIDAVLGALFATPSGSSTVPFSTIEGPSLPILTLPPLVRINPVPFGNPHAYP